MDSHKSIHRYQSKVTIRSIPFLELHYIEIPASASNLKVSTSCTMACLTKLIVL